MKIPNKSKLFEAVGAFLLLTAWFLEWGSVKKWDLARDDFRAAYMTGFTAYIQEMDNFDISASYMKNRLLPAGNVDGISIKDLGSVWTNSDVRKIWARHTIVQMKTLLVMEVTLYTYEKELNLQKSSKWDAVKSYNESIQTAFLNGFNDNDRQAFQKTTPFSYQNSGPIFLIGANGDAVPEYNLLSSRQADAINLQIDLLQVCIRDLFYSINKTISKKSESNTNFFRSIYAIGSIIIVLAFLAEAFRDEHALAKKKGQNRK